MFIIPIEHRDSFLHDDRPMIQFFVHEMHRAPGDFHPISERLLLRLQPGNAGNSDG